MEHADDWLLTGRLETELGKGDPFAAVVRATRMPMIITDPRLADNPIVFTNDAFCKLTGYTRDEIMGRNCRFLQGRQTDQASVQKLRSAIAERTDVDVDILNFRKDGTPFWNALYISPVFNDAGELTYFFASQLDVTARLDELAIKTMLLHEVDHRVKNNLQIISALLAMEAKTIADPAVAERLKATMMRIEALSMIHRRLYQSDDVTRFDVAEFTKDIVNHLVASTGRDDIAIDLDLETVHLPAQQASPLALIVNEMVTNAIKHAFGDGRAGRLSVKVQSIDAEIQIVVADDGAGLKDDSVADESFGTRLVTALSRQLGATTSWTAGEESGTRFEMRMPNPQHHEGIASE